MGAAISEQLRRIRAELARSRSLPIYEGVDLAWLSIIKLANLLPGESEHDRLLALLARLPDDGVKTVMRQQAVDILLNLNPPLESLLSAQHERLNIARTSCELETVRRKREGASKEALRDLAEVLKRIRNRRAHGFKTPDGPRDVEILGAATEILQKLGEIGVSALS